MSDLTLNELLYEECPCDKCHYVDRDECNECFTFVSWLERRNKRAIALKDVLAREVEAMFAS